MMKHPSDIATPDSTTGTIYKILLIAPGVVFSRQNLNLKHLIIFFIGTLTRGTSEMLIML